MVHLLAATALAAASPALPPSNPAASPAMFVVRDADTTVYLFGSFHALDGESDWFTDNVRSAFEQSGELVLETLVPEDAVRAAAPPRPIARPAAPTDSFLATTRMAIDAGRSQGMHVANGADMVLRGTAEVEGKPVQALETLESQFAMLAKMPLPPARPLKAGEPVGPDPAEIMSGTMRAMQAAWKRGDQNVFVRMIDQLRRNSPQTYKTLFADRNARWADWIAGRMQTPGVVFVAVGAGHFAGKDSVLVRLAEQGIESTRVN
jgi:uncharacterized protein YbaP (TraB family)